MSSIVTKNLTAEQKAKVEAARVYILSVSPYLASGLYRSTILSSPDVNDFRYDTGGRIYISEDVLDNGEVREIGSMIAHALLHIYRKHTKRLSDYRANVKNCSDILGSVSQDLEVNGDIHSMGFRVPPEAPIPAELGLTSGKAFETYANEIKEPDPEQYESVDFCVMEALPDGDAEGDAESVDSIPESVIDIVNAQMADAARQHYSTRGNTPSFVDRWVEEVLGKPKVPWNVMLRRTARGMMNSNMRTDYSRRKPSKRAEMNEIMAGMVGYTPICLVGVDTSGSMNQDDLETALAEANGVATQSGGVLKVFSVDMEVTEPQVYTPGRPFKLTGNGGTDMRVAYDYVRNLRSKPNVFILATDGETPWPSEDDMIPGVTCIALIIRSKGHFCGPLDSIPSWITVIEVQAD